MLLNSVCTPDNNIPLLHLAFLGKWPSATRTVKVLSTHASVAVAQAPPPRRKACTLVGLAALFASGPLVIGPSAPERIWLNLYSVRSRGGSIPATERMPKVDHEPFKARGKRFLEGILPSMAEVLKRPRVPTTEEMLVAAAKCQEAQRKRSMTEWTHSVVGIFARVRGDEERGVVVFSQYVSSSCGVFLQDRMVKVSCASGGRSLGALVWFSVPTLNPVFRPKMGLSSSGIRSQSHYVSTHILNLSNLSG
ncbi:hypothetical protein BV25DRAFT_1963938 [Artomyces pyxidatus]|uniref:Uncharacterized protein n=1 Tax=Artomyces pyxidatus TaxID=48021 RepID=A0ACB8SRR4_9AGAM|nr:hypothetical protein BV25DRAFT_1963938 [Artomyces pyxidatus]